jgi:AAHS family 4-hydroxybenzoate transporter-like MFS transporter
MRAASEQTSAMKSEQSAQDIGALIDAAPMSGLQRRVVALCALATFLDGYDIQALGLAVPRMSEEWGLPPSAFAPALSASLVGIALGAVLLAPLADRWGRRPMLVAMMILIGLTTAGAALASNPMMLTAWRVITGLALGAAVPIATSLTSEYAPLRRRAALVALLIACMALGSFAAGIVAPALSELWGWRGIFAAGAALPLMMAVVLFVSLPESLRFLIARNLKPQQVARQIDRIFPHRSDVMPLVALPTVIVRASVRALFAPVYRMRTILVWLIFWFNLFVIYSLISWLPTLLHSAGWTHDTAQRASGLVALGGIAGGLFIAWVADRGYAIAAVFIAYVATAVFLVLFIVGPSSVAAWIALLFLVGAGAVGGQMAAGSIATAHYYPTDLRVTGVGWFNGVSRTGAIAGPIVLAALMKDGWASSQILGILAIPMLFCAAGVLMLPRALRVLDRPRPTHRADRD